MSESSLLGEENAEHSVLELHGRFQGLDFEAIAQSDSDSEDSDAYSEGSDAEDGALEMSDEDSDEELLNVGAIAESLPANFERCPYPEDDTLRRFGRDGVNVNGEGLPIWANFPPSSSRRRTWNHWKQRSGGLGARVGIPEVLEATKTPADIFCLNLTEVVFEEIVKWTNQKAISKTEEWNLQNPSKLKQWKEVDVIEMRAFVGLLLLAGVLKGRKEPTDELWNSDEKYKRHAFTATMSRNRFRSLMQFLRFDDRTTRDARKEDDKLAAFRTCMDAVVNNLPRIYEPTEYLCVDEQLIKFRGRCAFRVYMKSKPGKYGIKVWACVDAKTGFVINLQVYTGKIGNQPEQQQGKRVLLNMIEPFFKSGRSVTADNFFGSVNAANELLDQKITLVCTMRKDRKEIPVEFRNIRGREEKSSEFWWTGNCTLVSYIPKRNRSVLVMSTQHSDPLVSTSDHKKPEIILHYNASKGGVDNADQMIGEYTCQRPTRRWPCKLMFHVTDTAALNAYIMWMQLNPDWNIKNRSRRRIFIRELAEGLITPQIKRRSWDKLNMPVLKSMMIFGAKRHAVEHPPSNANADRGFCNNCRRRVRGKCTYCAEFVCDNCSLKLNICPNCQQCEDPVEAMEVGANAEHNQEGILDGDVEEPNQNQILPQPVHQIEVEFVYDMGNEGE